MLSWFSLVVNYSCVLVTEAKIAEWVKLRYVDSGRYEVRRVSIPRGIPLPPPVVRSQT